MTATPSLPFSFDMQVEVFEKAGEKHPRRIGGFVTTAKLDKQGESLVQDGLNFDPFLKSGWFNDNHNRDTDAIVGYPDKAELMVKGGKRGWWVEGYLLEGQSRADRIWETAVALQKSNRRLGFSVEGKITKRSGNSGTTIAAADIKNVAITNCPVNDDTALEVLAKSLAAVDEQIHKALSMGAPAGQPGAGAALAPESLEGAQPTKPKQPRKKKRRKKKRLKKSEGVAFLMERYGIPAHLAERVYILTANQVGK
jgi:hypothetical protein